MKVRLGNPYDNLNGRCESNSVPSRLGVNHRLLLVKSSQADVNVNGMTIAQ